MTKPLSQDRILLLIGAFRFPVATLGLAVSFRFNLPLESITGDLGRVLRGRREIADVHFRSCRNKEPPAPPSGWRFLLTTIPYRQIGHGGQRGQQFERGSCSPVRGQVKASPFTCCVPGQQSGGQSGQQPG
jgi:hypothetical protein